MRLNLTVIDLTIEETYKYVVLHLSNGERHAYINPTPDRCYHCWLVNQFCNEQGFEPESSYSTPEGKVILDARNHEGVTLKVKGGGYVVVMPYTNRVILCGDSMTYGSPSLEDREAVAQELRLTVEPEGWNVSISV